MRIKCWFHDCEERSPEMHWLTWLLVGFTMLDWRFWVCKEHQKLDFDEAREELRKYHKLT